MNPFEYIRHHYGVPARRGGRVRIWTGETGTIIRTDTGRLRIRLDESTYIGVYHPAFGIEYLDTGMKT